MKIQGYFQSEFEEHASVLAETRKLLPQSFEKLVRACVLALKAGNKLMFFGNGGGDLHGLAEPLLVVPSSTTARIQEMHIMPGQMLCGAIEIDLGYAEH